MLIYIDGKLIHNMDINLAYKNPDWYSPVNTNNYIDSHVTIVSEKYNNLIRCTDTLPDTYDESLRPQLRFSQKYGWNNDPNGLVYYDGSYHLFYQSNPFGNICENMYWGHAISTDLIHWKELPLALYPNTMANGQCFSGSAHVVDNKMLIAFTDTNQGQCLARSDDTIIWKCDADPIIKNNGRDPKLIKYEDKWIMLLYEKLDDDYITFYNSNDLKLWEQTGKIAGFRDCPEMVKFGDKWVLFSANAEYMVGTFDGKTFIPNHKEKLKLHHGPFMASQCFNLAPDNRIIQIGWCNIDMPNMPFNQGFSLPLELSLKNERLIANPIKELEILRTNKLSNSNSFQVNGQLFEIIVNAQQNTKIKVSFGNNIVKFKDIHNLKIIVDRPFYEVFVNDGELYEVKKREDQGENINMITLLMPLDCEFIVYELPSIWQ